MCIAYLMHAKKKKEAEISCRVMAAFLTQLPHPQLLKISGIFPSFVTWETRTPEESSLKQSCTNL